MDPEAPTVRDSLAQHYLVHGLPADGGATDPWFRVHVGAISFRLPNPPARRRAVFFHDVNHLATGYNTTFGDGEMAIAAFEVGAGCGRFAIVWFINLIMFAIGLLVVPRTVWRAFLRGHHSISIYRDPLAPETLASMSVAQVRQRMRLDAAQDSAQKADYVVFALWAFAAVVVSLAPGVLVFGATWFGLRAWLR
jgi:hypothetical protein